MGNLIVSRTAASCFIFLLLVLSAAGRHVHYYDAAAHQLLLSDGSVSDHGVEDDSFLQHDHLKGMGMGMGSMGMDSSEGSNSSCHQMYGFLPCSTNIPGHIFLIVIYEYLLYCGESYVSHDARDLFFGKGYWGAVFFQLLDSLPEPLVLAASVGLSKDEGVEVHLAMAVGLLVGSSILLLTVVWGCCIFVGCRKFDHFEEERTTNNIHWLPQLFTALSEFLIGSGVVTDSRTSLDARFMLVSLMPFIVILIPMAVGVSSASESFVLFLSLLVAVLCLFIYFLYQHVDRKIQKRTVGYAEIERKMEMRVPFYEVQMLMRHRNKHLMSMGIEMEMNMGNNDHNIIGRDGVSRTFKEWFFRKIQSLENPYSYKKFNQVAQLLFEEKISLMKLLIDGMVPHDLRNNNDETQRKLAIDRIFAKMDRDGSSSIDQSELKQFLESEEKDTTVDKEVVEMIMAHLDVDEDGHIDPEEFKFGMTAGLWEIEHHKSHKNHEVHEYPRTNEAKGMIRDKNSMAIVFVGIGISMLIFFAEPLTHSVQIFSESVNIPPFYISLIFLPLAAHYRTALIAIGAARKKRHHTTSSTFSEIYYKVMMNNLMGFALILCVMIYRGLTWHFSAEVLTLVIVCGIVGIITGYNSKFPNWTLIIVFLLYPLSFIFFILVNIYFR